MTSASLSALLATVTLVLSACASGPSREPTMASMQVVAQNDDYALVRLQRGQTTADVARAFFGDGKDIWQLAEINASTELLPGQILAVPLTPVNSSSVYVDGYRTLPILCYHQFTSKDTTDNRLQITGEAFQQQMRYLLANDFTILSFADTERIMREGQPIPDKAVVITIDDGYRSVYDIAWPILQTLNIPATLFVYTDFIGGTKALNWPQMREMVASGLIEVESHARSHMSLSRLPEDKSKVHYEARVEDEIRGSTEVFDRHLNSTPSYLSYPYGNSSVVVGDILRREGYDLAATVTRGENTVYSDPYLLHRTMIYSSHDLGEFAKIVRGFKKKNLR